MIPRCICLPTIERRARSYAENRCHTQRSIKQSEASEPPPPLAPPAAAAPGSALRVVDATCACRAVTVEERSLSAAVRLVRFLSAAFAAMFMSWLGSVRAVGHHTTSRARQQPAARCTAARDAGSTTLHHLVDRDRLEPHPVQAQLVQDQAAASGGCGAAAGWLAALSEPPERLLDRHCAPG